VAKDGVFGQRSGECGPIHAVQDEVVMALAECAQRCSAKVLS
jgi:hypothetical protein